MALGLFADRLFACAGPKCTASLNDAGEAKALRAYARNQAAHEIDVPLDVDG